MFKAILTLLIVKVVSVLSTGFDGVAIYASYVDASSYVDI